MSGDSVWTKALLGGLGVAVFTFTANHLWERYSHRAVGPDYVHVAVRTEEGALLFFVRNESNEPLDLVSAEIQIALPAAGDELFGAYPAPSRLYEVAPGNDAHLEERDGRLLVRMGIAQAIDPGGADQFGLTIRSASGPLTPTRGSIEAAITDLKGNVYRIRY